MPDHPSGTDGAPMRKSNRRDRKILRASAMELHRIASDMKHRRGLLPRDDPAGYVDAFSSHLRAMARLCEESRDATCAQLKKLALDIGENSDPIDGRAMLQAVNALLNIVNLHARKMGVDPYEGLGPR